MGALKPKMALRLFEQLGFQAIVLADTDTVWLRDPESTALCSAQTPHVVPCGNTSTMWQPSLTPVFMLSSRFHSLSRAG
jgi:hypothetical protein